MEVHDAYASEWYARAVNNIKFVPECAQETWKFLRPLHQQALLKLVKARVQIPNASVLVRLSQLLLETPRICTFKQKRVRACR